MVVALTVATGVIGRAGPATAAAVTRPLHYLYVTVDHPGFSTTSAINGINDKGDFVVVWNDEAGNFHGALGSINHPGLTDLTYPGSVQTLLVQITDNGVVSGTFFDTSGAQHGFTWYRGAFTPIDVPGAVVTDSDFEFGTGEGTAVFGVNDKGVVAGQFSDAAGQGHGFTEHNGTFVTYDAPPAGPQPGAGFGTDIVRINDSGELLGDYQTGPDFVTQFHPYLVDHGHFTTIASPAGSTFIDGLGLSNNGVAAGFFNTDPEGLQGSGFLYKDGQMTILPQEPSSSFGFTTAADVNNDGVVVGEYFDANLVQHGYYAIPIGPSQEFT